MFFHPGGETPSLKCREAVYMTFGLSGRLLYSLADVGSIDLYGAVPGILVISAYTIKRCIPI